MPYNNHNTNYYKQLCQTNLSHLLVRIYQKKASYSLYLAAKTIGWAKTLKL